MEGQGRRIGRQRGASAIGWLNESMDGIVSVQQPRRRLLWNIPPLVEPLFLIREPCAAKRGKISPSIRGAGARA